MEQVLIVCLEQWRSGLAAAAARTATQLNHNPIRYNGLEPAGLHFFNHSKDIRLIVVLTPRMSYPILEMTEPFRDARWPGKVLVVYTDGTSQVYQPAEIEQPIGPLQNTPSQDMLIKQVREILQS